MTMPTLKVDDENDYAIAFAKWLSKEIKGYCASSFAAGQTFGQLEQNDLREKFLEEQRVNIEDRIREAVINYNKNFAKEFYKGE